MGRADGGAGMMWQHRNAKKTKQRSPHAGYKWYDLPLLASYPNSGTNLTRYIIEYFTMCPTPGQPRLIHGDNFCIDRAHIAYPIMHNYTNVIMLLRDYKECIVKTRPRRAAEHKDVSKFLSVEREVQSPTWYIDNLSAFDKFAGNKLLIYYECLTCKKKRCETVRLIVKFILEALKGVDKAYDYLAMGVNDEHKLESFLLNVDWHYDNAVRLYQSRGYKSCTGKTNDRMYHQNAWLTPQQQEDYDRFYFERYPDLTKKYLFSYNRFVED
jgi:hypothetical protein